MIRALVPADREAILSYASQEEAENLFAIQSFHRETPFEENRYFGFFEDGEMKGLLVFFGVWGSMTVHAGDPEVLHALIDHVGPMKLPLESVPGFRRYAEPVVERLKKFGYAPKRLEPSIVLSLPRSRFHPLESRAEQAQEQDRDALVLLDRDLHSREAQKPITDMERRRVSPAQTFVLREEKRVVSKAVLHGTTKHYGQIGGVVTHPDFRRRGYGRQCVSALCNHCFQQGIETMILFTSKKNHPAQELYHGLGFEVVDRYLLTEY